MGLIHAMGIKDLPKEELPIIWMVKLSPKFPKEMHEIKEMFQT